MVSRKTLAGIVMFSAFSVAGMVLAKDYSLYQDNVSNANCCGWVDPSPLKRPLTHLLVEWTEPRWKQNVIGTKIWLMSDGKVDGKVEFWTVWREEDVSDSTSLRKQISKENGAI